MKKFSFMLPLISLLFLLAGCGQQGYNIGVVPQAQQQFPQAMAQPMAAQAYPTAQVILQPGQAPQYQQPQPIYVMYDPRNPQVPPMQVTAPAPQPQPVAAPQQITLEQLQGLIPQQVQNPQPAQVKMQNVGLQIEPKYKGMIAGCQLFQMELDVGQVTMAKCKGFNDVPAFFQVSPATLDPENVAKKDKAKLVFNESHPSTDLDNN